MKVHFSDISRVLFFILCLLMYRVSFAQQFNQDLSNPNMDLSFGDFSHWKISYGDRGKSPYDNIGTPPYINAHTVMENYGTNFDGLSGPGNLPRVPSLLEKVARLGALTGGGYGFAKSYAMSYSFTVNAEFPILFLQIASVMDRTHDTINNTHFNYRLLDPTGNVVAQPCGGFKMYPKGGTAAAQAVQNIVTAPSFGRPVFPIYGSILYQEWQSVAMNLSAYAGQTLTVEFEHYDCYTGYHGSYSYVSAAMRSPYDTVYYCREAQKVTIEGYPRFESYLWSNGDTTQNIEVTNPQDGAIYTCEATSYNGCKTTFTYILKEDYVENEYTFAVKGCHDVEFTGQNYSHIHPISGYHWKFGDTGNAPKDTSTAESPTYTYSNFGQYNARYITENTLGCRDTAVHTITLNTNQGGQFTHTNSCYELPISFTGITNSFTIGQRWEFGDGGISTQQNPQRKYTAAGIYDVKLITESNTGCKDTITQKVTVADTPDAVFTYQTAQCQNGVFTFTNSSQRANSYQWGFGDGTISVQTNPTKTYSNLGTYTVKLYAEQNGGCRDSMIQNVVVDVLPIARFEVSNTCQGQQAVLKNTSFIPSGTQIQYLWEFWDNTTYTDFEPVISISTIGNYPITLKIISTDGCTYSYSETVRVGALPAADFNYTHACLKAPVTFTDISQSSANDITNWDWYSNGVHFSSIQSPERLYTASGTYPVKLVVTTLSGCKDSILKNIVVQPQPAADFILDGSALNNQILVKCDVTKTVSLSNQSIGDNSNLWSFGIPGANSTIRSPQYVYSDTGKYTIQLIINEGTLCADTVSKEIRLLPGLEVDFNHSAACTQNEITFEDISVSALNDIQTRSWDFGDGNIATTKVAKHTYQQAGDYEVVLVVSTQAGCLDTLKKTIQVHALPQLDFELTETCPGQAISVGNISSQTAVYQWDFGNGTSSEEVNPQVIYTQSGVYTIHLTGTSVEGCKDSISDIVLVRDAIHPVIDASQSTYCIHAPIAFTAENSTDTYQQIHWDFGNGQTSGNLSETITFENSGEYPVVLTLSNGSCNFSDTLSVTILNGPEINLGEDFTLCPGQTSVLTIGNTAYDTIIWSTGEENVNSITVNNESAAVSVEIHDKGCIVKDSVTILTACNIVSIPKAFSPNGDGVNDYFNVLPNNIVSYELKVYNRWGHLIFSTNNLSQGWDGTYNGQPAPMDNYTYHTEGITTDGTVFSKQGAVLLLR